MSLPADFLDAPLPWRLAEGDQDVHAMLEDLQGNILKPHGRDHVLISFLRFEADPAAARASAAGLGRAATSALTQLEDARRYRRTRKAGAPFVTVALSWAGYEALGVPADQRPANELLVAGLASRGEDLPILDVGGWEQPYREGVHALLLTADDDAGKLRVRHDELLRAAQPAAREVAAEQGDVFRDLGGNTVEHFGFVDGRSQPLVLSEDVEAERDEGGGDSRWPAAAPLGLALVPCPGGVAGQSFGSFLSYVKFEQNVRGFRRGTRALARALGTNASTAGAMVVGRFADGTSMAMSDGSEGRRPVWNNFRYADDPLGRRCPVHAHVRRMNPRGTSGDSAGESAHMILRRGITYGARKWDETRGFLDAAPREVGLHFLGYQASLRQQFEFLLGRWAAGEGFAVGGDAGDQLVGPPGGNKPTWLPSGDEPRSRRRAFGRYVTARGGEYFFVPSRSFLHGLHRPTDNSPASPASGRNRGR